MPNDPLTREETIDAVKQAHKEWMDEKFAQLGKWSARTILAAAIVALTYFILSVNGWHPK